MSDDIPADHARKATKMRAMDAATNVLSIELPDRHVDFEVDEVYFCIFDNVA